MVTYRKALALLLLATTLVVGIQITAPSTEITLELDGNSVRYRVADNSYEASYDGKDFSGISIKRSSSSVSETAIEWIKVGDEWILPPGRSLFLGGRLYGAVSRVVSTIPFRQTFGDWSMDRFDGPLEQITGHSFSAPFTLTARIIGRGATDVVLEGASSSLVATVRNGLMDNDLSLCVRDGECLYTASLQEPWTTSIKGLINTILSWGLLATLIALFIQFLARLSGRLTDEKAAPSCLTDWPKLSWTLASLLAIVHFGIAHRFASSVLGGIPHIPDSVIYMEQARTLAYGLLDITFPPNLPHEPFYTLGAVDRGEAMAFWYNRFWPFLIALALRGGFEGILLPLLSAGTALLLFSFTSSIAGRRAALVATGIYAFSPFTITQAGDFMTHVPTTILILAALEALRVGVSRSHAALLVLAGACSGFAFGIRPLTTVALAMPSLIWFVPFAYAQRRLLWSSILFPLGAAPLVLLLLLDNLSITGDALIFPHSQFHSAQRGIESLKAGANLMDAQAALLSPILFATPVVGLSLGLALLPLVLEPRRRVFHLVAMPGVLLLAYHFWPLNGLHGYGPRFLFEATPYLCALIGIGIIASWDRIPSYRFKVVPLFGFSALFVFNAGLLLDELPSYRNYNSISDNVARTVQRISRRPALVLIEGDSWQDHGYANMWIDPTLSDFIAIRKSTETQWEQVLQRYPLHERYSIAAGNVFRVSASGETVPVEENE